MIHRKGHARIIQKKILKCLCTKYDFFIFSSCVSLSVCFLSLGFNAVQAEPDFTIELPATGGK